MSKNFTIESVSLVQRGTDIFHEIYCNIKFAECSKPIPFWAHSQSADPFSVEMFHRLEALEFGEVVFPPSNYSTHPKTYAEWEVIHKEDRDDRLLKSDWTDLPSRQATMTAEQTAAWTTYRQGLRDITQQASYPWEVIWPTKP